MIAGDEQYGNPRIHKVHERSSKVIEDLSRDVVLVKEVSAMDEKICLHLDSGLYNRLKILKDGVSPVLSSSGVRLGYLCNLKSKMCVRRMNKLQNALTDNSRMIPDA